MNNARYEWPSVGSSAKYLLSKQISKENKKLLVYLVTCEKLKFVVTLFWKIKVSGLI